MITVYQDFNQVEDDIRRNTPPVIYKFRSWDNDNHKKIITQKEIWFAHPHTLNDPYDVGPPYNFIVDNIDYDFARKRMREAGRFFEPELTDQELEVKVEQRMQLMRTNPVEYFQLNRQEYVKDSSNYDMIGVFSCCESAENEPMWAHYGNNHTGFAVGFNTVELARAIQCGVGRVNYDDRPVPYIVMGDNLKNIENEMMQKSSKWKYEEELRFVTVGIGFIRGRASNFPASTVAEIVFGLNTAETIKNEVIAAASISLPGIPFFQVKKRENSFGFEKIRL